MRIARKFLHDSNKCPPLLTGRGGKTKKRAPTPVGDKKNAKEQQGGEGGKGNEKILKKPNEQAIFRSDVFKTDQSLMLAGPYYNVRAGGK
jgi:hypothetical protein